MAQKTYTINDDMARSALAVLAMILAAGAITLSVLSLTKRVDCTDYYLSWDRLQDQIADCREDPDCYLTLSDLERVRELAPRVAACELREGEE